MRAWARGLAVLCALLMGCEKGAFPAEGMVLGGVRVSQETLEQGRIAYGLYCSTCHGEQGDGRGPSGVGLRPPPRDLRLGIVKFASVPSGMLPRDEDLERLVQRGLHGTAMLGWEVPPADRRAIVQYLKTFSPRWRHESAGPALEPTADPWQGRTGEALARGATLYHGLAQCWTCHPAYATRAQIGAYSEALQGAAITQFRANLHASVPQSTEFGVRVLPPDFLRTRMKSGDTLADLYRTLAAGVGGTSMPGWRDVLPEDDLWALVHYVRSLTEMREQPEGEALRQRLADD
jgi:mono/diheme cytochrome c family protein